MFRDFQKIYFTLNIKSIAPIWGYGSADITEIYVQPSGVMGKTCGPETRLVSEIKCCHLHFLSALPALKKQKLIWQLHTDTYTDSYGHVFMWTVFNTSY